MQFILCVSLCALCGSLCNYVNYTEFHRGRTENHRVFCVLYFLIAPNEQWKWNTEDTDAHGKIFRFKKKQPLIRIHIEIVCYLCIIFYKSCKCINQNCLIVTKVFKF